MDDLNRDSRFDGDCRPEAGILKLAAQFVSNIRKGEENAKQVVERPRLNLRLGHPARKCCFCNPQSLSEVLLRHAQYSDSIADLGRRQQLQMRAKRVIDLLIDIAGEHLLAARATTRNLELGNYELMQPLVMPNLGRILDRGHDHFLPTALVTAPWERAIRTLRTL